MTKIYVHNPTQYRFAVEEGQDPVQLAAVVLAYFNVDVSTASDITEEPNELPVGTFTFPADDAFFAGQTTQ